MCIYVSLINWLKKLSVKYELRELDEIIPVKLKPRNFNRQQNKAAFFKKCAATVLEEVKRIRTHLLDDVLNCENEQRIIFYVQEHQHACTTLSDMLQEYVNPDSAESVYTLPALKPFIDDYKSLLTAIEALNAFIRNKFIHWYDNGFKITDHLRQQYIGKIESNLTTLIATLEENEISPALSVLTIEPFKKFVNIRTGICSHDLDYFFYYQAALTSFLNKGCISNDHLQAFLCSCNYNSNAFLEYYFKVEKPAEHEPIAYQIKFYYRQLKLMNQLHVTASIKYDPSLPDVKERISTWLREEINFLEKQQQPEQLLPVCNGAPVSTSGKLHTSLSVSNLSLGIKLLLDTGIIKTNNTKALIKVIAGNFRTEKSETISEISLRNKIYNIETAAATGMKDIIITLLNEVRKY